MKKTLFCFVFLLISILFVGCNKPFVSYSESSITLYENQEYKIDVSEIESSDKYTIKSLNEKIAKVEDYVIIPQSVGKTKIRLVLLDNKEVYFDISLEIKEGNIAKSVSLDTSIVEIKLQETSTAVNKIKVNEDCDEIPLITYDDSIINYDYISGVITAKAPGNTIVKIKFKFCETKFEVKVNNTIYTTSLIVNDCEVFSNTSGKLNFQVFPSNANTYRFWSDSEDFVIYRDGSYKSYQKTSAIIFYQYYVSFNKQSPIYSFAVNVVEKLTDFSFSIENNGNEVSNILQSKQYELIIDLPNIYNAEDFEFSTNIQVISELVYVEDLGYLLEFYCDSLGEQKIDITYCKNLAGEENKITVSKDIKVSKVTDLEIFAKWQIYEIFPDDNDKYQLYLSGGNQRPDSLYFGLRFNDEIIDDFQVMQVITDNQKIFVSKNFTPEIAGEYVFEIIFNGNFIGQVTVVVND